MSLKSVTFFFGKNITTFIQQGHFKLKAKKMYWFPLNIK